MIRIAREALAVDPLVIALQRLLVERLEANEHSAAAGLVGQPQALGVAAHVDRGLAEPEAPLTVLDDRTQQLLGPRRVSGSDAEEIVVNHEDEALRRVVPLVDDVGDAPAADVGAVELGYGAEVTADRAAARRLKRRHVVLPVDGLERLAGAAQAGAFQVRQHAVVTPLELAGFGVADDLRPELVTLADGDGVDVLDDLIGAGRGVRAADDGRNALFATGGGDFVGAGGAAGVRRQTDQIVAVARQERIGGPWSEDLVDDVDFVPIGDQLGEHLEPELRDIRADGVIALGAACYRID